MTWTIEPLGDHELDGFRCGNDDLDDWLRRHARAAAGHGTRTYVAADDLGTVQGSFALAPHLLRREDAPRSVGRGASAHIPAVLLAKLAVARERHRQGYGTELLVAALDTILHAARRAGGRVVVVDAIDEDAVRFYERHDFLVLPGGGRRLVLKLSTAAKALGVPWP